jgi:hypothetical protein
MPMRTFSTSSRARFARRAAARSGAASAPGMRPWGSVPARAAPLHGGATINQAMIPRALDHPWPFRHRPHRCAAPSECFWLMPATVRARSL